MKYLREMGHEISLIAPGCRDEMARQFKAIGVEVLFFGKSPVIGRFPSAHGSKEIVKICRDKNIDLIHAQSIHALAAGLKAAIR